MFKYTAKLTYYKDALRVNIDNDFAKYYIWLFKRETWNTIPVCGVRYGTHITVYNLQIHGYKEFAPLYSNRTIEFFYHPERIFLGGQTKGFVGYYLPVDSPDIDEIKKKIGIVEKPTFRGLHVSLFNNKHFIK